MAKIAPTRPPKGEGLGVRFDCDYNSCNHFPMAMFINVLSIDTPRLKSEGHLCVVPKVRRGGEVTTPFRLFRVF